MEGTDLEGRVQYVEVTAVSSDKLSLESLASTGCRAPSMSESIRSQSILCRFDEIILAG